MIAIVLVLALLAGMEHVERETLDPCRGRVPDIYRCGVADLERARQIYDGPLPQVRRFGVDFTSIRTGVK